MHVIEVKRLRPMFWPEFVEHEGGLFLSQVLLFPRPSLAIYPELTAAEVFYNHLHILDEFGHSASLDGSDPSRGFWEKRTRTTWPRVTLGNGWPLCGMQS
jgi:hypothetical protein